eukprot:1705270-Amphidinium_carterae.1
MGAFSAPQLGQERHCFNTVHCHSRMHKNVVRFETKRKSAIKIQATRSQSADSRHSDRTITTRETTHN